MKKKAFKTCGKCPRDNVRQYCIDTCGCWLKLMAQCKVSDTKLSYLQQYLNESTESTMKNVKAKVYSAAINGIFTQVKAYHKIHAVRYFKKLDKSIKHKDVNWVVNANSQQAPIDEEN